MSESDVIVIGGGIHGLTLALLAAERGWRTCLVERGALGGGASRGSFGVLHGGLRHLPRLGIRRMRRSARGQTWFRDRFPDLVAPLPCLLPLDGRGLRRRAIFGLALAVEQRLRGVRLPARGRVLGPRETFSVCPSLRAQPIVGAACWYDVAVKDLDRMVTAVAERARAAGVRVMANVEAEALRIATGAVRGVLARDHGRFERIALEAPIVVNCAGGEAAALARRLDPEAPELFHPVLAFNLLLDRPAPFAGALAVDGGRRRYFLRPSGGRLLAGTEYAPATGGATRPTSAQIEAFRAALARAVPSLKLDEAAVRAAPSGLLPGARAGETRLLERDVIYDHAAHGGPKGLITVAGVKFTTAPEAAEDALDLASLGRGFRPRMPQRAGRVYARIAPGGAR